MPSNSDAAILRLEEAWLGYPGTVVLEDIDLCIGAGEFWCVIGPNGSGKTTLLHALLGLIEPLAGRVTRDARTAARARTGFVPQHCEFSHALPTSVREFVSLGAIAGDRPRSAREQDLAWALERAQLAGMADRDYWSLSGGQRQRALVARALVRRPSLLVLDEPTEGMDLGSQEKFLATVRALHADEGSTVLFVTHLLEIAARHATHVAIVYDGGLVTGQRDRVLQAELLERAFGQHGARLARRLAKETQP